MYFQLSVVQMHGFIIATKILHLIPTAAICVYISAAYAKVTELLGSLRAAITELENTEKVLEVQQDIVGLEGLVQAGRVSSH